MKIVAGLLLSLLMAVSYFFYVAHSEFGVAMEQADLDRFSISPNFDTGRQQFVNYEQDRVDKANKDLEPFKAIITLLTAERTHPSKQLPEVEPDIESFLNSESGPKAIWLGHSTFLVNMGGNVILFDPVFKNAGPLWFLGKRFQAPVLQLDDLPQIDYVVISHDHYDHLEKSTIEYFSKKGAQFIVPLGVDVIIKGWGVDEGKVRALDWWGAEKISDNGSKSDIEFAATPALHFSGRRGIGGNQTLWASWVIRTNNANIYFSGDGGYGPHFKEIGNRYGPFDAAFIENGQYNPMWSVSHLFPEEGAMASKDLKAKLLIPVHWGMFSLAPHTWDDPANQILKHSIKQNVNLKTPVIGSVFELMEEHTSSSAWWQEIH